MKPLFRLIAAATSPNSNAQATKTLNGFTNASCRRTHLKNHLKIFARKTHEASFGRFYLGSLSSLRIWRLGDTQ